MRRNKTLTSQKSSSFSARFKGRHHDPLKDDGADRNEELAVSIIIIIIGVVSRLPQRFFFSRLRRLDVPANGATGAEGVVRAV